MPNAVPSPNVLLVEDEPNFARWAVAALQSEGAEFRVHVTHGLEEARGAWRRHRAAWRLAVVDLNLGLDSGVDLIREIAQQAPEIPVLVVTSVDSPDKVLEAIRAGAQGYILKSTQGAEFMGMVRQAMAGGSPITPSIARQLLKEFRGLERADPAPAGPLPASMPPAMLEKLSGREVDVLRLLARGYTDKEVAAQLEISPATVDTHVRKIYRKLSINSRVELRRLLA